MQKINILWRRIPGDTHRHRANWFGESIGLVGAAWSREVAQGVWRRCLVQPRRVDVDSGRRKSRLDRAGRNWDKLRRLFIRLGVFHRGRLGIYSANRASRLSYMAGSIGSAWFASLSVGWGVLVYESEWSRFVTAEISFHGFLFSSLLFLQFPSSLPWCLIIGVVPHRRYHD